MYICIHFLAFESMSIKIVDEICPFNLNPNTPTITVDDVHILSPSQFHEALLKRSEDDTTLLLDTRNYYESKIGHFQHAILPPIRKFSALPAYLDTNRHIFKPNHHLLTYCTGGIRCAKSNTFISAQLNIKVSMLDGGIHNYLEWIKQTGNKSLFLGRNYVFDARVSLGLEDNSIVSECVYCQVLEDKGYVKCFGLECHLFVVCCERCNDDNEGKVFCCLSCKSGNLKKGFCGCEVERRIKCATPIHCQAS